MKKWMSLSIALALIMTALSACGGGGKSSNDGAKENEASGKTVEISVLVGKEEIAKPFESMVSDYNSSQDKVKVSIIPLSGANGYERMTTLYASNNAPTVMSIGQELELMQGKLLDLSDQEWVKNASPGTLDYATYDGKVLGMPMSVEAFGFIYNKAVLDKVAGGSFDPSSVRTINDLKALFEKIEAAGVTPITVTPLDWSLGAHFSNILFTDQSPDRETRHKFLADMKSGNVDLANNAVFNGWMDTLDLMKQYNKAKDAPLSAQYDEAPLQLADGEAAMWFMGNWAYPQLKEADPDGEYGFLPVPVSNNADDYGNSQISASVSLYWSIDKEQSTPEEQAAAKDFLNWMVSSEQGQDYYVNQFSAIPAFNNFKIMPEDSLSQSLLFYMDKQQTLEWMNLYFPPDGYPTMGATLQKYLTGNIDRAGVAKEYEEYWKKAK
ncbi:MAG: ABC transporter substrate-binding protein [Paenibacillus macerans]|uniref:Bacterial extracellular solute-binding family protein n=1 Tax=Paenibacillus macerans TaxID=44252 RepID=A0A090ZHQ1_PAEMA|nr:ABC transporter substrate-binding protein [Paenibacillus macerans]KFN10132.1 bacterial extracellular solute-binding family protein [Paenibacillus macerans]MBS5909662.1 carbohydrate ABC transporter substrate-binding protein [Paenibacillus macerans]MCY7558689.1 ABC transporter substrate-binding protein [Paenibacillus macerans]MDU7475092.1 ABC transporter substrate-binding protein [Paenibacillus macerans]MEC0140232.1 ABC transporter substrate-binding protein [Paenibacillus macerans]